MPRTEYEINGLRETVVRPTVLTVLGQITQRLRISSETEIRYFGASEAALQKGSTIEGYGVPANKWPSESNVTIEVTETALPLLGNGNQWAPAVHPFFQDDALGVICHLRRRRVEFQIAITLNAGSKPQADAWLNRVSSYWEQGGELTQMWVRYYCAVPYPVLQTLSVLYALREKQGGYGETFQEYLVKHLGTDVTTMADHTQQKKTLAVDMSDSVYLRFAQMEPPEAPAKANDSERWTASISVIFEFEKPVSVGMVYPMWVHNQPIPKALIPRTGVYHDSQDPRIIRGAEDGSINKNSTDARQVGLRNINGVSIPSHDTEWRPSTPPVTSSVRIYSMCVMVDPAQPKSLFNLVSDCPQYDMDPTIDAFLRQSEYPFLATPFESVFNLSMYAGVGVMQHPALTCDSQLNLTTAQDMDIRRTYRVRFSVITNLTLLSQEAIDRLVSFPGMVDKIIEIVDQVCPNSPYTDVGKPRLTDEELILIGRDPIGSGPAGSSSKAYRRLPMMAGSLHLHATKN